MIRYFCSVACLIVALAPLGIVAFSTKTTTSSGKPVVGNKEICETTITNKGTAEVMCVTEGSSLWSDVAIKAAKQFTITQRQKLKDLGALDVERPIRIIGEPISDTCDIGECVFLGDDDDDTEDDDQSNIATENEKIIHFQRHGQGYHNLICDMWREAGRDIDFDSADPNLNPVVRPEFLDPPLTALGMQQCRSQRELCSMLSPELVIVSPMLRCIQTAKLSFHDHEVGASGIPWVSHEGCREELGLLIGNKRRPISEIQEDYPEIDFSPIPYNEDKMWDDYGDRRETLLEKSDRIYDFLTEYVMNRPEKEIAIVCHSAYLFTLLNAVMDIEDEQARQWFLTSEVRSLKVRFSKPSEEDTE